MTTVQGNEPPQFDWGVFVPLTVHPLRVAIIEALLWIGRPLSATDLTRVFDEPELNLSAVSYHVRKLAKAEVLVKVRQRPINGSIEKFYFFP